MRPSRPACSLVAVVTAAVTLTGLPLAAPALAVEPTPVERLWTVVDSDGDDYYGLWAAEVPGSAFAPVAEASGTDRYDLSASADGSRITYVKETASGQQLVVQDNGGRVLPLSITAPSSGSVAIGDPVLSPDGNTVAWTQYSATGTVVRKANVATGAITNLVNGYYTLGFLDGSTLLVEGFAVSPGVAKSLPLGGGVPSTVSGLPADVEDVAVAGGRIAWTFDTSSSSAALTSTLATGTLSNGGGTWSVTSNATPLATALENDSPAFSLDGETVYWVQWDGDEGPGDVLSRDFDAQTEPVTVAATSGDEVELAVTRSLSGDTTDPAAPTALPAVLGGTAATVRWTLPGDADLSGVRISRPGRAAVFVAAPVASFRDTGLTLGQTYTYSFTAFDRSGRASVTVTRQVQAIAAGASFGVPTSRSSTKASFPVRFATGGDSQTKYYVQYLPSGGTLTTWVNGASGAVRTFGAPASPGVAATTSTPGRTYRFRVKAEDQYGNASGYVASAKAVVPYDQGRATYGGGVTVSAASAYLGSYRRLSATSTYARIQLTGDQLMVVGWKCAGCGSFAVYQGSTRIATVNTYSAKTVARTLLFTKTYTSTATRTFTIRPLGTSGHPNVLLDGFATRR